MSKCPNCGAEVSDSAQACPKCGKSIAADASASEHANATTPAQSQVSKPRVSLWWVVLGSVIGLVIFWGAWASSDFSGPNLGGLLLLYAVIALGPYFLLKMVRGLGAESVPIVRSEVVPLTSASVKWVCPRCGSGWSANGREMVVFCNHCGGQFEFVSCSRCHTPLTVQRPVEPDTRWSCRGCTQDMSPLHKETMSWVDAGGADEGRKASPVSWDIPKDVDDSDRRAIAFSPATGSGLGLVAGETVVLSMNHEGLSLTTIEARKDFSWSDLISLEVGGPGTVTTDAGVGAFGFSLVGFAEGVLVASAINSITTQSKTLTTLRIMLTAGEALLLTHAWEPNLLRQALTPAFEHLARNESSSSHGNDIASSLAGLDALHTKGSLSDSEFDAAKKKLLGGAVDVSAPVVGDSTSADGPSTRDSASSGVRANAVDKCPSCGTQVDDAALFCPECGASISQRPKVQDNETPTRAEG